MRITVELFASTGSFETDFKRASKTAKKEAADLQRTLKSAAKGIAVALTTGFAANFLKNAVRDSIEFASTMHDVSEQTGIAAEDLSVLEFAATKSGTELEALAGSLGKFNKTIAAAAAGSKGQAELFKAMGVSLRDDVTGNLKGTNQLLTEVAAKFASYRDGPAKAALAQEAFGKSGDDLLPFLNAIGSDLEGYKARAKELGLILSTSTIDAQEQFGDELQTSSDVMRKLKLDLTREFLPTLSGLNNAFIGSAKEGGSLNTAFVNLGRGLPVLVRGFSYVYEAVQVTVETLIAGSAQIAAFISGDMDLVHAIGADWKKQLLEISNQADQFRADLAKPFVADVPKNGKGDKDAPLTGGTDGAKEAAKEAIKARKAMFEKAAAQSEVFNNLEKAKDDERLAALEDNFARGLVDFREYYDQRYVLAQAANDREIESLQNQIESTKSLRDEAKEKSEQINLDTKLIELEGKLKVTQEEGGNDHLASLRAQNNAIEDQRRALADLEAEAALSRGERAVGSRGADLEQARRMRQVSDEEYYRNLAELEDAHYSNLVDREEAARAQIHGNELDQIRARQEITDRLETIEGEHAERIKEINRDAQAQVAQYAIDAQAAVQSSFEDAVAGILDGTLSIKDAFRQMANDILRELARISARQIASEVFGSGGKTGGNGWVGQLFSSVADYFKGGGSSPYGGSVPIDSYASGGGFWAGQPMWVGEDGPELIMPKVSGDVLSHDRSTRLAGGHTFNMPITIMAPESRLDRRSINQVRYAMGAGVSESLRSLG